MHQFLIIILIQKQDIYLKAVIFIENLNVFVNEVLYIIVYIILLKKSKKKYACK